MKRNVFNDSREVIEQRMTVVLSTTHLHPDDARHAEGQHYDNDAFSGFSDDFLFPRPYGYGFCFVASDPPSDNPRLKTVAEAVVSRLGADEAESIEVVFDRDGPRMSFLEAFDWG